MMRIALIAMLSIAMSVAAQFLLKAAVSGSAARTALAQAHSVGDYASLLLNRYLLAGFALYGLGAFAWLAVLSKWDVSKAYPLVGVGFVLSLIVGLLLGERITVERALGVALICAGVVMVGRS